VRARPVPRLLGCLAVAALFFTSAARAGAGRVVTIDLEPRVADALVVALSPWSLAIVRTPGPCPAPEIDAASSRARLIAVEQHADAVVWITPPRRPAERGSLWVYEALTMALAVRPLTVSAPFDDAGAAAVALSVKTILRASPLAGPEPTTDEPAKRAAVAPAPTASAPTPAPVLAPPPAPALAPAPMSRPPAASADETPRPARAAPRHAWRIETVLGARAPTGGSDSMEPRVALGGSVWRADRLGLGLQLQAGPGVSVGSSAFQGELREGALEATGRLRVHGDQWVAFEFLAGPALVLSSLDGHAAATGKELHALRLDPALNAGTIVDLTLGSNVCVGLIFDASALLRFQRYALDGAPLLREPSFVMLGGVRLSLEVD
ncbi:MAG TPA: hypothetical protein VH137_07950, partial [Gemmatimonadales bacterium]|nr:hypothetical protein [Gemmatimonadales bacterium]